MQFPFPFPVISGKNNVSFPFPKCGNGMSIPVPKNWEWNFPVPVPKSWVWNFSFPFPKFAKIGLTIPLGLSRFQNWDRLVTLLQAVLRLPWHQTTQTDSFLSFNATMIFCPQFFREKSGRVPTYCTYEKLFKIWRFACVKHFTPPDKGLVSPKSCHHSLQSVPRTDFNLVSVKPLMTFWQKCN